MDKPMIGIRQADGSFYEIMGDAQVGRKRLVLSAARTDQHGVKIDLYRSVDGSLDQADSLGSISLDDPEGLGYKDIEFRLDLDPEGQLEASAALPGQPPRSLSVDLSPFQGPRSDSDILSSDNLSSDELDTLDDQFSLDPEPMTLDLPEVETEPEGESEPERRSDADILGDESLASADLDTLDDFSFDTPDTEVADSAPAPDSLGDFDLPAMDEGPALGDVPALDDVPGLDDVPAGADSFDLGDLDAGFGDEPVAAAPAAPAADEEDWEKISLDDMESMEFMDTGAEISSPTRDEFSMDDHDPLELNDLDSDLSDLPDLGDASSPAASDSLDDLDHDFLAPPELTDNSDWDVPEPEPEVAPRKADKATKAPKPVREKKQTKGAAARPSSGAAPGGLDKTALFLSLATLSLLVLLILVLLFLNMIKAPAAPVIQPEVMHWKSTTQARASSPQASEIDLAAASSFEASSVLEIPEALKSARITLRLEPGETTADAARRFGAPARSQGNLLFW